MVKSCQIDADVEAAFIKKLEDRAAPQVPTRTLHAYSISCYIDNTGGRAHRAHCRYKVPHPARLPNPRPGTACTAHNTPITSHQDGTPPLRVSKAASSSTGKRSATKKEPVNLTLDSEWVLEHAIEVARTLPGGTHDDEGQIPSHQSDHVSRVQDSRCLGSSCGPLRALPQPPAPPSAPYSRASVPTQVL